MHCTYFVKKSSKNGFVLWIMFIHIKLCSRLHHLQDFHRASVTLNTPVLFPGVVVQHGEKKKKGLFPLLDIWKLTKYISVESVHFPLCFRIFSDAEF